MLVRIAARQSDLARIQAYEVANALMQINSDFKIEFDFRQSLGDLNQKDPLWKMPEKGVFTEDFYQDLINKKSDLVVHSWKDLPLEPRKGLQIKHTLPRGDMRDILLIKKSALTNLKKAENLNILSSSPRRIFNLQKFLPLALPLQFSSINFVPVRGNVPTRIDKLITQIEQGLVVAKVALDRLLGAREPEFFHMQKKLRAQLQQCVWMVLPLSENPAAAAQGALAIETRQDLQAPLKRALEQIHCSRTFSEVMSERKILASYGGGCHQKIGVSKLSRSYGKILYLRGQTEDGKKIDQVSLKSSCPLPRLNKKEVFPHSTGREQWFERRALANVNFEEGAPIFVARAEALPDNKHPRPNQLVWTSGVKTWKKLAARGVWVHGTYDGLGENEKLRLEQLASGSQWTKLTHKDGLKFNGNQTVASYELIAKKQKPNLQGKSHFFWSSGSSFKLALKENPWISQASHYCGPGNTYKVICDSLENSNKVRIFLNYDNWLREAVK